MWMATIWIDWCEMNYPGLTWKRSENQKTRWNLLNLAQSMIIGIFLWKWEMKKQKKGDYRRSETIIASQRQICHFYKNRNFAGFAKSWPIESCGVTMMNFRLEFFDALERMSYWMKIDLPQPTGALFFPNLLPLRTLTAFLWQVQAAVGRGFPLQRRQERSSISSEFLSE